MVKPKHFAFTHPQRKYYVVFKNKMQELHAQTLNDVENFEVPSHITAEVIHIYIDQSMRYSIRLILM